MQQLELKSLVENGFLVYIEQNKFLVEKRPTNYNKKEIQKLTFDSLDDALGFVNKCLQTKEWKAIARYNRGLGIEYKTLQKIEAETLEEAKDKARKEIENNSLKDYIIEIKVTRIF